MQHPLADYAAFSKPIDDMLPKYGVPRRISKRSVATKDKNYQHISDRSTPYVLFLVSG